MGVRFACHGCGKPLNIKTELAGKRGKCPSCGLRFRIPPGDQEFSIPLENGPTDTVEGAEESSTSNLEREQPSSIAEREAGGATNIAFDPLEDSQAQWYVRPPSGGRYGPADNVTLRLWINEGRITPDTLLWRDGWAQWRSGDEVIPQFRAETKSQVRSTPSVPTIASASASTRLGPASQTGPTGPTGPTSPTSQTGPTSQSSSSLAPIGSRETKAHEPYPSLKRRRKSSQRTIIVVCLIVSILLLIALIAVLMWPRQSSEETRGRTRPVSVTCLASAESIAPSKSKNDRS